MKKIMYAFAGILAVVACAKENTPVEEGPENNVFTLTAGLPEVPASKVSVETDGKVTWSENDAFAVWTTSGTKVKMTISGGIGTNLGTFTGTIDGELDTSVPAVYPYDWAAAAGKVEIPHYIERSDKVPAIMASSVSNDGSPVLFKHLAAVMEFTLKDVPAYACAFKLWSKDGAKLSGTYSVNASLNGLSCESGNTDQIIYFPYKTAYGSDAVVKIYAAIPAYDYTDLAVRTLDGDESVIEGTGIHVPAASAALSAGDYVAMPELNIRGMVGTARDKFIKVEGVKWAKGNLRAWKSGPAGEGWQDGWNIYANQWENQFNLTRSDMDGKSLEKLTLDTSTFKEEKVYTHWDYFSWGTLGRASRVHNAVITSSEAEFDICGKVFSGGSGDISQKTELEGDARFDDTGGFTTNPSICGDLAFWASKGKYRLPKSDELKKLYARYGGATAHMQAGYYMDERNNKVRGILFTSCPSWETPRYDKESEVALSAADMEAGLFLPKSGERTTNANPNTYNATTINFVNGWGVYWSGTYGGRKEGYEDCARHINFTGGNEMTYGYTSKLSQTITGQTLLGNCIRPVLVD